MSGALPPIEALLPQAGPMRLLERVLAHDAEGTRCLAPPSRAHLFADARGRVPVWVAIEWMAQCAAVDGGLRARARGEAPRPGLFLGSRRLRFHAEAFEGDRPLEVEARLETGRGERFAFACAVREAEGGPLRAEGRLAVLVPRDFDAFVRRERGGAGAP